MADFESELKRVKADTRIETLLAGVGVSVNRVGMAHCPFHNGDKGASLKVYANNTFHCFGCHKSGDVIDLYRSLYNVDFKTAFELLGGKVNKNTTKEERAKIARIRACNEAIKEANLWLDRKRRALELQDSNLCVEARFLDSDRADFEEKLQQNINARTETLRRLNNLNEFGLALERKINETYK